MQLSKLRSSRIVLLLQNQDKLTAAAAAHESSGTRKWSSRAPKVMDIQLQAREKLLIINS
jgi:hypothetical protein